MTRLLFMLFIFIYNCSKWVSSRALGSAPLLGIIWLDSLKCSTRRRDEFKYVLSIVKTVVRSAMMCVWSRSEGQLRWSSLEITLEMWGGDKRRRGRPGWRFVNVVEEDVEMVGGMG